PAMDEREQSDQEEHRRENEPERAIGAAAHVMTRGQTFVDGAFRLSHVPSLIGHSLVRRTARVATLCALSLRARPFSVRRTTGLNHRSSSREFRGHAYCSRATNWCMQSARG